MCESGGLNVCLQVCVWTYIYTNVIQTSLDIVHQAKYGPIMSIQKHLGIKKIHLGLFMYKVLKCWVLTVDA